MTRRLLVLTVLALAPISVFSQARRDESPDANSRKDQPQRSLQSDGGVCVGRDINEINIPLQWHAKNCLLLHGGFSDVSGSFIGLSYSTRNFLRLGEILSLSSEYGVRRRRVQFGFDKSSLFGTPVQAGFTVYGQRFHYDQARESSVFAFQREIPEFNPLVGDRLDYVSHSYGGTAFAKYPLRGISSHVKLTYSYDVSDFRTLTASTSDYFTNFNFQDLFGPNVLNGIRTSKLTPSFTRNTLDDSITLTRGTALSFSTAVAGLGGNVNTIEPAVEAEYFHSGFKKSHVIGARVLGRLLTGYGGNAVPPFDRYYMGGEQDLRGFDSWSISPIVYVPSSTAVNILNNDGTPRTEIVFIGGVPTLVNVTMPVPIYRIVSSGGDTKVVMNLEYRIPMGGPFTLAFFTDAGVNRLTFRNQLQVSGGWIDALNRDFPGAAFDGHPHFQPGTQKIRMSNGVELQVLVPKIKAPLRFYGAYNPLVYQDTVQAPLVLDANAFPNAATYRNALVVLNTPVPWREHRFLFRFSIGRTFGGRS